MSREVKLCFAFAIFIVALVALIRWIEVTRPEWITVYTAKQSKGCQPPTEFEQLHIIVRWRGERLVADCMYVGARGAYRPMAKGPM